MAVFRPIIDVIHLPPINVAFEHSTLDAKKDARSNGAFLFDEMAKDVAAFANALGGTILIGAVEDAGRVFIEKYEPLTDAEAGASNDAFADAVTKHCSPRPLINGSLIRHGGGVILAMNVWPFMGQLVGVSKKGLGAEGRPFTFPHRLGNKTMYVEPEQHPMFMTPAIRRTIILLEGIPQGERGNVQVVGTGYGAASIGQVTLTDVRPHENIAIVERPASVQGAAGTQKLHLTLDDVMTVSRMASGIWRIRLREGAQY